MKKFVKTEGLLQSDKEMKWLSRVANSDLLFSVAVCVCLQLYEMRNDEK